MIELAGEPLREVEQQLELPGLARGGVGVAELEGALLGMRVEVGEGIAAGIDP